MKIISKIKYIWNLYWFRKLLLSLPNQKKDNDGYVLFNAVRQNEHQQHIEYFMAFLAAVRGNKCIILVDDGLLGHWDSVHFPETPFKPLTPMKAGFFRKNYTKFTTFLIKCTYAHANITTKKFSDFLTHDEICYLESTPEKFERHVVASCKRYSSNPRFQKNVRDQEYYKISMLNAYIIEAIANKIISQFQIKKLITSHGIYTSWGVLFDTLKNAGVNADIYGLFIYKNKSIIITKEPEQQLSKNKSWATASKSKLSHETIKQVDKFFNDRINFTGEDSRYYYSDKILNDKKIIRDSDQTVFGMFPNIVWDGDIVEWNINFSGVLDWVKSTVELFNGSKNQLVIRFHPSEDSLVTWADSLEELLRREIPDIDNMKNITIIPSSYRLNLYKFIKDEIDIGLVYDGILGMEMTYMEIPNITCAEGRYGDTNFSIEPKSRAAYEAMILNPQNTKNMFRKNINDRKRSLYRFTDWYTEKLAYRLPIIDESYFFNVDLSKTQINDIDENHNLELRRTLDRLLA